MYTLANDCLRSGIFPTPWKSANVIIIKKSMQHDPTEIKSYRPISLLPVLAKALEKVICDRLLDESKNNRSPHQYGFVRNKSTFDAIKALIEWHNNSTEKFTVAIFLDISGAFDNLDWDTLHLDLERLGCSPATRAITKSYLHNRRATVNIGGSSITVGLTGGCPQGSIFGPAL